MKITLEPRQLAEALMRLSVEMFETEDFKLESAHLASAARAISRWELRRG